MNTNTWVETAAMLWAVGQLIALTLIGMAGVAMLVAYILDRRSRK